ncbi:hypothetical protein [Profundibacter sp.]
MNDEDPSLQFIASVLAHCIKNGGISTRQQDSANRVMDRVVAAWMDGNLDCQFDPDDDGSESHKIGRCAKDKPTGRLN